MMKFDWIEEGILAASPLPDTAEAVESLAEQGIRAIITMTERPLTVVPGVTSELFARLGITSLHVPVDDFHAPNKQQVAEIVAFIDQMQAEGKPALVHCWAGQGRTGVALHTYYLSKGWGLEAAKRRVVERRPICNFDGLSKVQKTFIEDFAISGRTIQI